MVRTGGSSSGLPRAEQLVRDDDDNDNDQDTDAGLSLTELKQQAVNALANSASACYEGIIAILHAYIPVCACIFVTYSANRRLVRLSRFRIC